MVPRYQEDLSSTWCVIALKTESRYDATLGGAAVVIMIIIYGDHGDDKVGIMTIVDFRYHIHGAVNIRLIIATISW